MTSDLHPADPPTSVCSISRVEHALGVLRGRWKLLIIHHLLVRRPRRFSDLERVIPEVTQKMLVQQLRALKRDGVVRRIVYDEVPPHVEYELTQAGAELATALYALHDWAERSCSAASPAREAG
ncbi:helix-turn-helix domain-containing protein [Streptomyces sp. NPDC050982]|uniref:winged helix-turn-helix transcriptional regulator n=1 Tax=Streptomyces sp. NPDC050982 TaxID=3154746 RepID=UPI0033D09DDD